MNEGWRGDERSYPEAMNRKPDPEIDPADDPHAPSREWYYEDVIEGGWRGPVSERAFPTLLDYGLIEEASPLRHEEGELTTVGELLARSGDLPELDGPVRSRRGALGLGALLLIGALVFFAFWSYF